MKIIKSIENNQGFSLLEILIASLIATIILTMIYQANKNLMLNIKDMTSTSEFYQDVSLVTRRMNADITSAYFVTEGKTFFRGEKDVPTTPNTKISFSLIESNDFSILGSVRDATPQSDTKAIEYYLVPDTRINGVYFLVRKERNLYDDDSNSTTIVESIMLQNVLSLTYEFLASPTDNTWENKWDSTDKKSFPCAIRTTLKIRNYREHEEVFEFVSLVNVYK